LWCWKRIYEQREHSKKGTMAQDYEVVHEGEENILYISLEDVPYAPSLEESSVVMARTIEILTKVNGITKIIFTQKRDYEYEYSQTQMLVEIADAYKRIIRERNYFSYQALNIVPRFARYANERFTELHNHIFPLIKSDPIGAYVELKRIIRRERILEQKTVDKEFIRASQHYISLLAYVIKLLDETKLISLALPDIAGYKLGKRDLYWNMFAPTIKPDFMFAKIMSSYPTDGEEVDSYTVGEDTKVTVFTFPDNIETLYHVMPPEFKLSEDRYELLDMARKILAEHKPQKEDFVNPKRMREVFSNVGRDLLEELAQNKKMNLSQKEIDLLTRILVRYTVGFGLIEVLLQDEKIQDISVNSPAGKIPLFVVHDDYSDCKTNIIPTLTETESWASKLRMISGRPLDEADPILDTELTLPSARTRVSVISKPLNPTGLAYSFRRHRDKPWTLPLFIKHKMITPLAAGVLSFLIDGTRTLLIAGTRSAGKTSFLAGVMIEIMRKYRLITVEDTLELPTASLRDLGFNIQSLKVASALARETTELSAEVGIRSTLRLGDSALIVGEVRSKEAVALYEAMRVGAAANVVAGTIHGDSPYGVYDRVVNDIGIPKTSFKATDIIVVANPIKSADGLHKFRRITQITEVRKHWENDPLLEKGFIDLMKYNAKTDLLEPTDALINGESEIIKTVAGNIKEFAGNWEAVWNNIMLRTKTKELLVNAEARTKREELLEAPFVIKANDAFHLISERVKQEAGSLDTKRILFEWETWFNRELKKE